MSESPIRRVLIANRGEIAVRIIRACRDLGPFYDSMVAKLIVHGRNRGQTLARAGGRSTSSRSTASGRRGPYSGRCWMARIGRGHR